MKIGFLAIFHVSIAVLLNGKLAIRKVSNEKVFYLKAITGMYN
jgi:hypothetical protein